MGTRSLILCGEGEPLLHPRLLDLIRLSKQAGFRTVLITNGTLLSDQMVEGLIASRLDSVRVSLWATTSEAHEKASSGANSNCVRATTSGLARLQSAKLSRASAVPRTSLHVVLTRTNWRELDSFAEIANETGVNALSFAPLHTVFGRLARLAVPKDEEEALVESLRRLGGRLRSSGLDHNIDETIRRYQIGDAVRRKIPCYVAWTHPRIWVDGAVKPCGPCDWPMGNLRERSFREIWNGPAFRSFRKKILDPTETAIIDQRCDCSFCCHVTDCERIHRFYRWLAPITRLRRT
jgi:MoaA/NifB/PqqE/SkfB family radical SAM enzyme